MNLARRTFRILTFALSALLIGGGMSATLTAQGSPLPEPPFTQELLKFTGSNGESISYYLVKPKDFDATKRYPLTVYLHGVGGDTDSSQIESVKKQLFSRGLNCVFLAPLASYSDGQFWIDYSVLSKPPYQSYDQASLSITPALLAAKELIEQIKTTCHTDPNRSYLIGTSMGGYGAWDLITRYPNLFTAAVPICGAGDPKTAAKIRNLPVWAFHGTADTAVSVEGSRNMIKALRDAGSAVAKYTEYDGLDHGIWFKVFEDPEMLPWLFSQGTGIRDSFDNTSLMSQSGGIEFINNQVFGGTSYSCLARKNDTGFIQYQAESGKYIYSAQLETAMLYDSIIDLMNRNNYSINDLICMTVQTEGSSEVKTIPLSMSTPVDLGKEPTGTYTYSSVTLTPTQALPDKVVSVRFNLSSNFTNWYMLLNSASVIYKTEENQVEWVEIPEEEKDLWDGSMTEGWNGIDDFNDFSHTVSNYGIKCELDPFINRTVLVRTGSNPGYVRYAQKGCYITDFVLDAALIEGFLPPDVNQYFTVLIRTEGSDKDVPIELSKTEGTLLYENTVPSYNYYSSLITPKSPLPDKVISVKIKMLTGYVPYTVYLDKATMIFKSIGTSSTGTSSSGTSSSATSSSGTTSSATSSSGTSSAGTSRMEHVSTTGPASVPNVSTGSANGGIVLALLISLVAFITAFFLGYRRQLSLH